MKRILISLTLLLAIATGVNAQKNINQMILSRKTDQERKAITDQLRAYTLSVLTATVSYVGKSDYKEAERYIRDFHLWTVSSGGTLLIEISAVNGRFILDIAQHFTNPIYVNAFLNELDENGITYDLQDVKKLELPNIILPWNV